MSRGESRRKMSATYEEFCKISFSNFDDAGVKVFRLSFRFRLFGSVIKCLTEDTARSNPQAPSGDCSDARNEEDSDSLSLNVIHIVSSHDTNHEVLVTLLIESCDDDWQILVSPCRMFRSDSNLFN